MSPDRSYDGGLNRRQQTQALLAEKHNPRLGSILAVLSGASFACMGAFIKSAATELDNEMVVFLRNLFGLLVLAPWIIALGRSKLRTERIGSHLLRSLFGLTAMYCFFYAIPRLNLAEAVLLNYSAPLFVPLIAWAWLGERPRRRALLAVPFGLLGVVLIIKPTAGIATYAGMIGLFSGIFAAVAMVGIRHLSTTEPFVRIVFYFSVAGTLVSAVPLSWAWQTPTPRTLMLMAAAGMFATFGQLLLTRAYGLAPAVQVAALTYTTVAFSALLGWGLWSEQPDLWSWLGMAIVAISAVVTVRHRWRRPSATVSNPADVKPDPS